MWRLSTSVHTNKFIFLKKIKKICGKLPKEEKSAISFPDIFYLPKNFSVKLVDGKWIRYIMALNMDFGTAPFVKNNSKTNSFVSKDY